MTRLSFSRRKVKWGPRERMERGKNVQLTKIASFVLNLQSPDAEGTLAPVMDRHEGPRVEPIARGIMRTQRQQRRPCSKRRRQMDLDIPSTDGS
jgi:hypothetical protein